MANIAPTWPRPAAFSNSARAAGWSFGAAAAGQHHLGQHDLGLDHADVGGALDPGAALLGIGVHAAALDQHAAIPVLRVHHAVGGAAQPFGRLAVVALDADAFGQADAEIERRDQVAGRRRLLEPLARVDRVVRRRRGRAAAGWRDRPGRWCRRPGPRRGTSARPPPGRAARRHRSGAAGPVRARRRDGRPPRRGGTTSPPRHSSAAACRPWHTGRRPRAAASGSPASAARRSQDSPSIGLAATLMAFHQGEAPAGLAGTVAFLRCLPEQLDGRRAIRRHPEAALGHDRQQIQRGRQPGIGGVAQILGDLVLAAPGRWRRAPATAHSRGRPAGNRRRPTARTSDAPRPGRAGAPGRRSGYSPAPPGHRPNRLRPPCAPI